MAMAAQGVIFESSGIYDRDLCNDSTNHQSRIVFPILMVWEVDAANLDVDQIHEVARGAESESPI